MVFSSLTFLLLFLVSFIALYFLSGKIQWRNYVLLFFSLVFYAWGEPVWILAMLVSTFVNWVCAYAIVKSKTPWVKKLLLAVGVIISISSLVYFKYAAFFANSFASIFSISSHLPVLKLPIGISFYTFQILTYTIDVYRKKVPHQKNPLTLLLYVSCFPQLIAGPIVQYADIAQSLSGRSTSLDDFSQGMRRFAVGLAKKVLIANICGKALLQLPGVSGEMSVAAGWLFALLYAMQIYFDFSAYSDMAIGIGRVIGFRYKENFDYPYISKSITEFWRRWHISLSAFFRDYVYIPLGGNRKGTLRNILNILIVWSLTGLWHGASWNFVMWGLYYGILLIVEKFVLKNILEKIPRVLRHISTMIIVLIGWVIFYHTNVSDVLLHIKALFGGSGVLIDEVTITVAKQYSAIPVIAVILSLPIIPGIKKYLSNKPKLELAGNVLSSVVLTLILILSVFFLVSESFNPFIYFRF